MKPPSTAISPYSAPVCPDRHNRMPMYTAMRDMYAHDQNIAHLYGLKDLSVQHFYEDQLINAVPFDFSDVAAEVIDRMLKAEATTLEETAQRIVGLFDWMGSLPASLPPYPLMAVEMDTNAVTEMGRMLALIETEDDPEGFTARLTVFLSMGRQYSAVVGPVATSFVRYDTFGQLVMMPPTPEHKLQIDTPALSIDVAPMPMLQQIFDGTRFAFAPNVPTLEDPRAQEAISEMLYIAALTLTTYALFGCSLTHCKNVEEASVRLNRQTQRQRARRNLPFIEWKTLQVRPVRRPRTPSETVDVMPGNKHVKRLHGVEGHFAEYGDKPDGTPYLHDDGTPKGKLFGRYSGVFWIPAHYRGLADVGTILKTYQHGSPVKGKK